MRAGAVVTLTICVALGCDAGSEPNGAAAGGGSGAASGAGASAEDAGSARGSDEPPASLPHVTDVSGSMEVEVGPAAITAVGGMRIPGDWRGRTIISGTLLMVASYGDEPQWIQTYIDPRWVEGGVQLQATQVGLLKFPGDFIASQQVLSSVTFDFYQLRGEVPLTTKVVLENADLLTQGSVPMGSVPGSAFVPFFF